MYIKSLKINNLRNISTACLEPAPGLNLLVGENGAGKTSIIEALVLLAKGRSFRSGKLQSLVGNDAPRLRLLADIQSSDGKDHRLGLERNGKDWKARINGRDIKQLSELSAYLPIILLEPNSHLLVSGSPDHRRRYLDWGVFHVKQNFLEGWRRYSRALKQRNAALRMGEGVLAQTLTPQLAKHGEQIDQYRQRYMDLLAPVFQTLIGELSPGLVKLSLDYSRGWGDDALESYLKDRLEPDLERGVTFAGPHRADINVRSEGKLARERLSRGEQKIVATAMILAQAKLLQERGERPVLLMDDVASEFDSEHLKQVVESATSLDCQVFFSGVSSEPYELAANSSCQVFHVKHGVVEIYQ